MPTEELARELGGHKSHLVRSDSGNFPSDLYIAQGLAINSFRLDEMSPVPFASHVRIPTLLYQVKDDALTRLDDIQGLFDNVSISKKELTWIEGTSSRWDGTSISRGSLTA